MWGEIEIYVSISILFIKEKIIIIMYQFQVIKSHHIKLTRVLHPALSLNAVCFALVLAVIVDLHKSEVANKIEVG